MKPTCRYCGGESFNPACPMQNYKKSCALNTDSKHCVYCGGENVFGYCGFSENNCHEMGTRPVESSYTPSPRLSASIKEATDGIIGAVAAIFCLVILALLLPWLFRTFY